MKVLVALDTHGGEPEGALGSQLKPGTALATGMIWGVKQTMRDLSLSSLSLSILLSLSLLIAFK